MNANAGVDKSLDGLREAEVGIDAIRPDARAELHALRGACDYQNTVLNGMTAELAALREENARLRAALAPLTRAPLAGSFDGEVVVVLSKADLAAIDAALSTTEPAS